MRIPTDDSRTNLVPSPSHEAGRPVTDETSSILDLFTHSACGTVTIARPGCAALGVSTASGFYGITFGGLLASALQRFLAAAFLPSACSHRLAATAYGTQYLELRALYIMTLASSS